jgi:hypothetical protein
LELGFGLAAGEAVAKASPEAVSEERA